MPTNQCCQTILVVDDEQTVCETTAVILRSRGYVVHTANNGSDALRRLEHMRFDLVISDLNMPGMSGFELIFAIRSCFPSMLIMAMSAVYAADCLPGELDAFYAKGQDSPQQLLSLVEELLSRQHDAGVKPGKRAPKEAQTCGLNTRPSTFL